MRPVPETAVEFVSQWEGCKLRAYQDIAAVWTAGFGHTGPEVHEGLVITLTIAKNWLRQDLSTARARIFNRIGDVMDELSESQFVALLSFVFNLGDGDPAKKEWSIWKVLRQRQFDQVPAQLMRFVNAGGKPVKGLVRRRTAECELWLEDAAPEVLPSSATRAMPTPPTPADTKPLSQSKSFMTAGAATIATAATAVTEVSKAVSPFAAQSEIIAHLVSTLALIAAGLAVATMLFIWLKKRNA